MLSLTIIVTVISLASLSSAKQCPKIVTQNPFDITKVSRIHSLDEYDWKFNEFSMRAFGMKFIEVILSLKLEVDVLMQRIH